ncbi:unnamed protein product [Adineta steineri]|uniref:Cullin family profile domain-containing protein n=1 Tax=Adineta steineri TaxID=433720 RepID=A0A814CYX3_9BILA|nr:unnamed protein product [Adineta steineri]CAF1190934.1 unnamed protein product [Adineta steineri]
MPKNNQSAILNKTTELIDKIFNLDNIYDSDKVSLTYMELYTLTFDCFNGNTYAYSTNRLRVPKEPAVTGEDLYVHLENYLRNKLDNVSKDIDNISNENILQYYKELHYNYKRLFKVLNGSYSYLSRRWIQHELDSGRRDVYKIDVVAEYFTYEINQAKTYLPEEKSTLTTLIVLLETIFLPTDIFNIIVGRLQLLVSDENKHQELAVLFEPIHQLTKLKNELLKLIETHVYQKAIESITDDLINNPLFYIETIVNIHGKYQKLIQETFVGDQHFVASFDKGYAKFANQNPVSKTTGITMTLAEILARYCDTLLRKGCENDDWNEKLNIIMIIFNYLNDKDVFMKFYQKMLRKRLIDQLSVSDSYEETLISEFKKKCGYEYTSKLEQMIKDIHLSDDLTNEYRTYQEDIHGNETSKIYSNNFLEENNFFSVVVLTSNSWLFSHPSDIILPIEFKTIYDNFTTFYLSKHTGRKLILLHQYSKGELQINFTTKKYRLQVSTYQMLILLLFNQELIWTVEQIQDKTQIRSELLFEILLGLLKSKLLIADDPLTLNSRIKLAENFISDKTRLNLNLPSKPNEQKDQSHLVTAAVDERQMVIQAALVRIMKKERTLKHSLLIQQVIQQLTSNFKPDISLIKKYIEILIEKEYFQRDSNDKDTLHYLA